MKPILEKDVRALVAMLPRDNPGWDQDEEDRGMVHEREHTDAIARRIARDHLRERPDYYQRLDECMDKAPRDNPEEVPTRECVIPEANMARFRESMAALAKRATKLGLVPAKYTVLGKTTTQVDHVIPGEGPHGSALVRRITVPAFSVVVELTPPPHMEGWTLVAIKENIEGEALVSPLAGFKHEKWMDVLAPGECQHCKVVRNRRDTFLLVHKDGRRAQVGRSCLADFLPRASPELIAASAEYYVAMAQDLDSFEKEWDEMRGPASDIYDVEAVVAQAVAVVRAQGEFVGRFAAESSGAMSTGQVVYMYVQRGAKVPEDMRVTDSGKKQAAEVLAWVKTIPATELEGNDFLRKVRTLADIGRCRGRHVGIVAAVMAAWGKTQRKKEIESFMVAPADRQWVGTVGKREDFTVRLEGAPMSFENQYGTTFLHRFIVRAPDGTGHAAIWWGSKNVTEDGEAPLGEWFAVKATVKSHDTYQPQGVGAVPFKQTVLTRVTLVSEKAKKDAKKSVAVGDIIRFLHARDIREMGETGTVTRVSEVQADGSRDVDVDTVNGKERQFRWLGSMKWLEVVKKGG